MQIQGQHACACIPLNFDHFSFIMTRHTYFVCRFVFVFIIIKKGDISLQWYRQGEDWWTRLSPTFHQYYACTFEINSRAQIICAEESVVVLEMFLFRHWKGEQAYAFKSNVCCGKLPGSSTHNGYICWQIGQLYQFRIIILFSLIYIISTAFTTACIICIHRNSHNHDLIFLSQPTTCLGRGISLISVA